MEQLLNLGEFWTCLDSTNVSALAQTCSTAYFCAKRYRKFEIFAAQFSKKMASFLNTIDYSHFRATCRLTHTLLPEHDNMTLLRTSGQDRSPFATQVLKKEALLALMAENCFHTSDPFEWYLGIGESKINAEGQFPGQAIVGIKFFIPAGQALTASILITGQVICEYNLPAVDSDRILDDTLFNRPLPMDGHYGIWYGRIIISSNCEVNLKMTHYEVTSPLASHPIPNGQLGGPCYSVLVKSKFSKGVIPVLRVMAGMVGWPLST